MSDCTPKRCGDLDDVHAHWLAPATWECVMCEAIIHGLNSLRDHLSWERKR